MAILRSGEPTDNELDLVVNNGDLRALRAIREAWGFKDEESVLRFALAVLSKTNQHVLYYQNEQGEKVGVQPADAVRQPKVESEPLGI
jgi:hypothetical protein